MKVVENTTFLTLYYIHNIYQVFSNNFMQNQQNTQKNSLSQEKMTEIIVYFRENERK